jgi:DNA-binding NarL/FixJ family response regulator
MDTSNLTRKKVFLVDDSTDVRDRLTKMLATIDGVEICGNADNPNDAIEGILATRPDFVVLDYQLLGGTCVEILRDTKAQLPETVFIVLSNHSNPQYRRLCKAVGATHYFDKSMEFARVKYIIAGPIIANNGKDLPS